MRPKSFQDEEVNFWNQKSAKNFSFVGHFSSMYYARDTFEAASSTNKSLAVPFEFIAKELWKRGSDDENVWH